VGGGMQMAPQMSAGGMDMKSVGSGQTYQVQNCPNGLNVRSSPNSAANLVGTPLPNGTVVQVFNRNGVWCQHAAGWSMSTSGVQMFLVPVTSGMGMGMGMGMQQQQQQPAMAPMSVAPAVTPAAAISAVPEGAKQELHTVINANKGLNVRNGPGTEFALVGAPLANGSQVVVIGTKNNWAQHLSGWSLASDGNGTIFLQPVAASGGASGGAMAAHADGAGAEGQPQSEGVVACEFCHAPFKSDEDVFCSKCGKSKTKAEAPPAFNPNFS